MTRIMRLLAVLAVLAMLATACGETESGGDEGDEAADTTEESADSGDEATDDAAADEDTDTAAEEGDDAADAGGEESFDGAAVTITGPERSDSEAGALQEVLGAYGESIGIDVTYQGDADWEANINTQVAGGNPPDISVFPQPGKLQEFAEDGFIVPLTEEVNASIDDNWIDDFQTDGQLDGEQFGVPVKTDLKSLVWYQPARFEADGYEVPETFEEFTALVDEMAAADGPAPLCVGIESGQATGWPFTDWVEEMVLRQHGPDVYDQWVSHEIPFDDPQIVESMQTVLDLWNGEGNVFAASGSIAATNFGDNATPLVDGQCYMHRQANFFASFFDGASFADGSEEAIDVFYFPDVNGDAPVLTAGTFAAAFNDDPATMAILEYMATGEYAAARQEAQLALVDGEVSGFLSAAQNQDEGVYSPLEQSFLEILNSAEISRFDGSDLMPADVGAGEFWSAGTSAVNGELTAEEAASQIEAAWPAE